jgi:hypothetical protein
VFSVVRNKDESDGVLSALDFREFQKLDSFTSLIG